MMASRGQAVIAWALLGLTALLLASTSLAHAHERHLGGEAEGKEVSMVQKWLARLGAGALGEEDQVGEVVSGAQAVDPSEPPPEAKLAIKLVTAVGAALKAYYASEVYSAESPFSCIDAVGNETQSLLTKVAKEVDGICGDDTDFKIFCSFYKDLRNITVVALVSKLEINPISLAVSRTAVEGSCAPPQAEETALFPEHVHRMKKVLKEQMKRMGGKRWMRQALDGESPASDVSECKECIKKGFKVYAEILLEKIHYVCSTTKCPKIKAACKFAAEHKYLTQVSLLLKLKPWEAVVNSCVLVGQCRPPTPDSVSGKDLRFLPNTQPFMSKHLERFHGDWPAVKVSEEGEENGPPKATGLWNFFTTALWGGQAAEGVAKADTESEPEAVPVLDTVRMGHGGWAHIHHRRHEHEGRVRGHSEEVMESIEGRADSESDVGGAGSAHRRMARVVVRDPWMGPLKPRNGAQEQTSYERRPFAGAHLHTHREGGLWGVELKRLRKEQLAARHGLPRTHYRHFSDNAQDVGSYRHKRVFEGEQEATAEQEGSTEAKDESSRAAHTERSLREGEGEGGHQHRHDFHHGAHMDAMVHGYHDRVKIVKRDGRNGGTKHFQPLFSRKHRTNHEMPGGAAGEEASSNVGTEDSEGIRNVISLPRRALLWRHHHKRREQGEEEAEEENAVGGAGVSSHSHGHRHGHHARGREEAEGDGADLQPHFLRFHKRHKGPHHRHQQGEEVREVDVDFATEGQEEKGEPETEEQRVVGEGEARVAEEEMEKEMDKDDKEEMEEDEEERVKERAEKERQEKEEEDEEKEGEKEEEDVDEKDEKEKEEDEEEEEEEEGKKEEVQDEKEDEKEEDKEEEEEKDEAEEEDEEEKVGGMRLGRQWKQGRHGFGPQRGGWGRWARGQGQARDTATWRHGDEPKTWLGENLDGGDPLSELALSGEEPPLKGEVVGAVEAGRVEDDATEGQWAGSEGLLSQVIEGVKKAAAALTA